MDNTHYPNPTPNDVAINMADFGGNKLDSAPPAYADGQYQESPPYPNNSPPGAPQGNTTKTTTTAALQFRSMVSSSDPNSKSGKLYAKMSAIVGQNNICPIPAGLVDEEDRKLWLKSDSNSLLYFFYKSPKVRNAVQEEIDKGYCYHACNDSQGNCTPLHCQQCCMPFFLLVCPFLFWTVCLARGPAQSLPRRHSFEDSDIFMLGSRMNFRDNREFVQEIDIDQTACCPGLSVSEFDRVYQRWFYEPVVNAGFNFPASSFTKCYQCCFTLRVNPKSNQHQHIYSTWAKYRYGKKGTLANYNVSTGTNALIKYRQDCIHDATHPLYNTNLTPRSYHVVPGGGRSVVMGNTEPYGWIGQREIAPDEWETQIPLADLNLKELDYVVQTHNKKWGSIKPLDPSTLSLQYIYPGQSK